MQLLSLKLENFQAHENLELKFSSSITTLVGPTDAGKSAVLRALRWTCLNDFAGDDFIHWDAKEANVTLLVDCEDETRTIVRHKGRHNIYTLDKEEYKAFGVSVPPDIAQVLNLSPINFQSQHDSPFWFNESAPEVSRRLNAVVDLSVIDTALSNAAGYVRDAQETNRVCEERVKEAQDELAALEPMRARIEEFKAITSLHDKAQESEEGASNLRNAIERLRERRDKAKQLAAQADDVAAAVTFGMAARRAVADAAALRTLIAEVERLRAVKLPPSFSEVERLYTEQKDALQKVERLSNLLQDIKTQYVTVSTRSARATELEKDFHTQIKGKECPLCQNQL